MKPTVYLMDDDPISLIPMSTLIKVLGCDCLAYESAEKC